MTTSIAPFLPSKLFNKLNDIYLKTLNSISNDYNISEIDLIEKYKLEPCSMATELGIKKRNRRILDVGYRCMGRKFDGVQCTRSRRAVGDYCLSHEKNLPQGRIDDTDFKPKEKGKRGRKRKDHTNLYDDTYLATTIKEINNKPYLIDINNNVFTYNIEHPQYMGKLVGDNIVNVTYSTAIVA